MGNLKQQLVLHQMPLAMSSYFSAQGGNQELNQDLTEAVSFVRAGGVSAQLVITTRREDDEAALAEYTENMRANLQVGGETLTFVLVWIGQNNCQLTITSTKVKK